MFSSPRLVTDYISGRDLSIFLFVPFYEKYNFNNIVRRKVKLRNIGGIDLPLRLESKLVEAHVGKDLISLEITGKLDDVYFDKNKSIKNELESFVSKIDLDKDDRFYSGIFKRFEELKRYDSYREKKKLTDKEKEQKKCMEANLLKVFKEGCISCDDFEDCLKD